MFFLLLALLVVAAGCAAAIDGSQHRLQNRLRNHPAPYDDSRRAGQRTEPLLTGHGLVAGGHIWMA